ncbi:MAG TPA: SDR family oxidoreductase [Gemmatimonadaceae bacterium]|nr:SDR family oxidoreductase [Gemmatimonadaceae bacterium]
MKSDTDIVFLTGATGLVGGATLERMLVLDPLMQARVLVRNEAAWTSLSRRLGPLGIRVRPVFGDLTLPALGLDPASRTELNRDVTIVVHAGADTSFSRPLADARRVNTGGTREMLSLAEACVNLRRFGYVSTAFVAGRQRGVVLERDNGSIAGWVNAYEQSKYEAELLVRDSATDWVVFRPSTIVCRGNEGSIPQINAVHRALRVYHRGLAAMMPGERDDSFDVVTSDYVSDAIARVVLDPAAAGATLHLCAGENALSLGELVDTAYDVWDRDPSWRRRGIERAVLTDLDTYTLFANSVIETGDARLAAVLSSLSHFIPQLALSKRFDTSVADRLVGSAAPAVRMYWTAMLTQLIAGNWSAAPAEAA